MKYPHSKSLKFLLWIWAFFLSVNAYTQHTEVRKGASESTLPVVVLPSPNASTLTRNISENVDLYTGKLSLEVPLYNLKSRTIEIPISIQTTANAHRVNEMGTWIGMGWQLNAGGLITRVMKNLPDEFNGTISPTFNFTGVGYLNLNTSANGNIDLRRFNPVMAPLTNEYSIDDMKDIIKQGNWNTQRDRPNIGYDLQPDEFYFNFGKYSGKFTFDQSGNIVFSTENNIMITPAISNGKITGFTALTDDGYTYEFGNYALNAVEETKLKVASKTMLFTYRYTGCSIAYNYPSPTGELIPTGKHIYEGTPFLASYMSPNQYGVDYEESAGNLMDFNHANNQYSAEYCTYPSSWYLTKITAPYADVVTFTYVDNGTLTYIADRSFSRSFPEQEAISPFVILPCPVPGYGTPFFYSRIEPVNKLLNNTVLHYPSFGDNTFTTNTIELKSKRLSSITSAQGYKVSFLAGTSREDLPGDKRLDEIRIENNESLIKKITFSYDIVQNNDAPQPFVFQFKRPKYIYSGGAGGSLVGTTGITDSRTITDVIDPALRKRMFLASIQEVGPTGESLPPFKFDYYDKTGLPYRTSYSQDVYGFAKDGTAPPVESKMLAGVLKSIKYPTGGSKEFEFEVSGNTVSWNGLRIKSIKERASAATPQIIKSYTYGTYVATDEARAWHGLPDFVFNYLHSGQMVTMVLAKKNFESTNRYNPESQTRGAAGGYSFAEVRQPGNGLYRVEFYTGGSSNDDEQNNTLLVSGLNGGFIRDMTATYNIKYPFPNTNSNDWKRGLPIAEYIRDENNKDIKSTHYGYDFTSYAHGTNVSTALQVSKYRVDFGADWNWMLYGRYQHRPRWQLLKSKAERIYASNGTDYQENKVENSYVKFTPNQKTYLYPRDTRLISDSRNEQAVEVYKYPLDYTPTADHIGLGIAQLKSKNVLSPIVEKFRYLQNQDGSNKRYLSGQINKYYNNKPLLYAIYELQPSGSLSLFTESAITSGNFTFDTKYKVSNTFLSYDASGNIQQQTKDPDVTESYLWDYNSSYPVAKVVNANIADVAYTSFETNNLGGWTMNPGSAILSNGGVTGRRTFSGVLFRTVGTAGKYIVTGWGYRYGTQTVNGAQGQVLATKGDWALKQWTLNMGASTLVELAADNIDEVRLYPENALMTTFTFDPLIGMTSQGDVNNRLAYFEYDGLQRLKLIRDQDNNVVKTFEYNYRTDDASPMWSTTSERRCKPCEANAAYNSNIQQVKQIDINPGSTSYEQSRWLDLGVNGACIIQPDWQIISGPTCLLNGSGFRTGVLETIQKDMNPCSQTYNTTRSIQETNYTACPSNIPNWQATSEYRCAQCGSTIYTSTVQERKWVDMNPASSTYLTTEWRVSGSCVPPAAWTFTSTAERCQIDGNGIPTGYLEREQKDLNPCSYTFNELRWVTTTASPACQQVYMSLSYENIAYGFITTADVVVHFWYDENFTVPANVSNVSVRIMEEFNSDCGYHNYTSHTFTCSGEQQTLLSNTAINGYEISPGCWANIGHYFY